MGHQKVLVMPNLQTESQQIRSELLVLFRWRPFLITPLPSQVPEGKQPTRHPERRGRHAMAIIKISEALTYDTNSRFAVIIVKPTSVGLFSHQ